MPQPLDGKFYGTIFRHRDNQIEPPDSWIVFVTIEPQSCRQRVIASNECVRLGAFDAQTEAIERLIQKVDAWRAANPDKLKTPDVEPNELAWDDGSDGLMDRYQQRYGKGQK